MGERKGTYRVLVGKPNQSDHLYNLCIVGVIIIKMDLQEVEWGLRMINVVMNLPVA
jgi:hypothetical protein